MDFIKTYFSAEKSESLLFISMGTVAIVFSAFTIWRWTESFYKGLAIPLIAIGLIQIVVGCTIYFRTDEQISDLEKLFQTNPSKFKNQEISRMEIVMKNFNLYKKIEIALILIGLLLILFAPAREFWLGIGVGMLLQGAAMLSLDIFAERRGIIYIEKIS
jgi:hypothetical protein